MRLIGLLLLTIAVVAACAIPPLVLSSSPDNVSVNVDPMVYSEQEAVDAANAHCAAEGKKAVLQSRTDRGYGAFILDYNCE